MVLIKNMYLPESCLKCPLSLMDTYGQHICFITENIVDNHIYYGERDTECPMEQVEE